MVDPLPLNEACAPPKSKEWSCRGCLLYQYSPTFSSRDREAYQATLDPDRKTHKNGTYKIAPAGPESARVLALLDYPGNDADAEGAPAGGHIEMLRRYAKQARMDINDWRLGYAIRCHPPDKNRQLQFRGAIYCTRFLSAEIQRVKPEIIATFGVLPTQLVLGKPEASILEFHGVPQHVTVAGHECDVFPLWGPGYVQKNDYLARKYMDAFNQLADFIAGKTGVAEDQSRYRIIRRPEDAIALCRQLHEAKSIDLDLETSGLNPYEKGSRICIVALAGSAKEGYAIPYNHNDCLWSDEDRARFVAEGLRPLLCSPTAHIRLHNAAFDYRWIRQHMGFWPRDISEDTMVSHYAVDEREANGLKFLAMRFTDMGDYDAELDEILKKHKDPVDGRPRYDLVPLRTLGRYAARDPVATRKLSRALRPMADAQGPQITALAYRVMPALVSALTRMQHNGLEVDTKTLRENVIPLLEGEYKRSWGQLVADPTVHRFIVNHEQAERDKRKRPLPIEMKRYFEFSLNSPKQLQELIYGDEYFHEECLIFTPKGSPATDKEVLEDMAKHGSPIAKLVQECRLDEKMLATYTRPILKTLEAQGNTTLHGSYLPHGTKTGRLSSSSPNLQNQPNKSKGLIKRMFVSRYGGDGAIIQSDFSQIELRILAAVTEDANMLAVYAAGGDIHVATARMIFHMSQEEWDSLDKDKKKRLRTIAKRINFGICLAEGTPILTQRGFVAIEQLLPEDLIWDGEDWCAHGGVVCNGVKDVIDIGGISCTPDHLVLTDEGWVTADTYVRASSSCLPGFFAEDARFILSRSRKERAFARPSRILGVRTVRVYDILRAGPRNRFQAGSHIVHNCYGIGSPGIMTTLKAEGVVVTEEEAQGYLDTFFEKYPSIKRWIEKIQDSTYTSEISKSLFGRHRRLDHVRSYVRDVQALALRQAVNHVIQSTAADMTNTALILFDQEVCIRRGDDPRLRYPTIDPREFPVDKRWQKVKPILQVHDMLGLDAHLSVAGEALERLVWTMEHVVDLAPLVWGDAVKKGLRKLKRVPILADPEVGPNWRDAYKAKASSEVAKAMHVARMKQAKFDASPLTDWGPEDETAALASYQGAV